MSAITAAEARKSLSRLIQQVNDDHTAVEVVSRNGNAVILSKDDYDAMTETAYLLRNPANAERLLTSIERARRGAVEQQIGSDGPPCKWVTTQDLNRMLALAPIVDESWIDEYQRHRAQEHDPIVDPWDDQR